jgi:radical SAM protein with 4Fe4S-binding SPASM domain
MGLVGRTTNGRPHDPLDVFGDNDVLRDPEYRPHVSCGGKSRPVMLICETTNICNNDCIVCPYGIMRRKKSVMPPALFEKVLADYSDMGGGALSLTPMVGDVFLDKFLVERVRLVRQYPRVTRLSLTTNAAFADRFSDEELAFILAGLDRVQVSVYGLTAEEHAAFTRKDDHDRVVASVRKLFRLRGPKTVVTFGFRVLKKYEDADFKRWIGDNFGVEAPFGATRTYANWGGKMDTGLLLPWDAEWAGPRQNTRQCLLPLVACQVFVNGDVSFCPCCDYDALPDFALGNVTEQSLLDIYNSPRVRRLWNWGAKGNMPDYCNHCTFHMPLDDLPKVKSLFQDPIGFIGG